MTSAVTASLDQRHALFVSLEHTRALPGGGRPATGPVLTRAGVRRRLDQITGTVLVGLGTRLALDKSPVGVT